MSLYYNPRSRHSAVAFAIYELKIISPVASLAEQALSAVNRQSPAFELLVLTAFDSYHIHSRFRWGLIRSQVLLCNALTADGSH
jgi:hypothetical protein